MESRFFYDEAREQKKVYQIFVQTGKGIKMEVVLWIIRWWQKTYWKR